MANGTVSLPSNLAFGDGSPKWLNKADNTWQLTATSVRLQSVPGLIILYGGAVNSAFMAPYAFACVLFWWILWTFRMSFGEKLFPFWGKADITVDRSYLLDHSSTLLFPNSTFIYFQFVFAAITLILIAGALLGHMNFYAWILFVPLRLTFSYTFVSFSVWSSNGFLFKLGIIDFTGGCVIQLASGVAGFTAAHWASKHEATKQGFDVININTGCSVMAVFGLRP